MNKTEITGAYEFLSHLFEKHSRGFLELSTTTGIGFPNIILNDEYVIEDVRGGNISLYIKCGFKKS